MAQTSVEDQQRAQVLVYFRGTSEKQIKSLLYEDRSVVGRQ